MTDMTATQEQPPVNNEQGTPTSYDIPSEENGWGRPDGQPTVDQDPAVNGDTPQGEPPAAAQGQPPVNNEHVEPGATQFTPEEIAANAANAANAAAAGDLTLEDMQIAMLSATEVTFKNGRSLPIVKFTDANGNLVTNLANATCAHAGDGSISIPLVGVPIAR